MRKTLSLLVLIFLLLNKVSVGFAQHPEEPIYSFINSLSLKHKNDLKKDKYFLAQSAEQHLGPRITEEILKEFEDVLNKEDLQFIVEQFNNPVILKWDQKKLKKATVLTQKQKKRKEIKGVYYLEPPLFTRNGDYAVFKFGYSTGNLGFEGCIRLYQKTENGWKKIKDTWCIIS